MSDEEIFHFEYYADDESAVRILVILPKIVIAFRALFTSN